MYGFYSHTVSIIYVIPIENRSTGHRRGPSNDVYTLQVYFREQSHTTFFITSFPGPFPSICTTSNKKQVGHGNEDQVQKDRRAFSTTGSVYISQAVNNSVISILHDNTNTYSLNFTVLIYVH